MFSSHPVSGVQSEEMSSDVIILDTMKTSKSQLGRKLCIATVQRLLVSLLIIKGIATDACVHSKLLLNHLLFKSSLPV